MRFALAIILLAGCGSWSNDDIEYLYALPQKDALKSKLESTGGALTVGEMSQTYDDTKKSSDEFNQGIDNVLALLDAIRSYPPTRRLPNARFWGPFEDKDKHPGYDIQVEIYRLEDGNYTWAIKSRKQGGDWYTLGSGEFKPTASLRKGQGNFYFDGVAGRELYQEPLMDGGIDRVDVGYATDVDPVIVHLEVAAPGKKAFAYDFNGGSDKSAALSFEVVDPTKLDGTEIHVLAGWDKTTAGRADYLVISGTYAGFSATECWSDAHTIVYGKQNWPGGMEVGNSADCVLQSIELKPLPP